MSIFIVLGAVLTGLGALAYAGVWRWWTGRARDRTTLFGAFWAGIGFLLIGLSMLAGPESTVRLTGTAVGAAFVIVGMLGAWWTPLALTPRWFRAQAPRPASVDRGR